MYTQKQSCPLNGYMLADGKLLVGIVESSSLLAYTFLFSQNKINKFDLFIKTCVTFSSHAFGNMRLTGRIGELEEGGRKVCMREGGGGESITVARCGMPLVTSERSDISRLAMLVSSSCSPAKGFSLVGWFPRKEASLCCCCCCCCCECCA